MNNNTFSFFYDEQIRRYLLQFMRIFSLIKIRSAPDENGIITESTVPIRYGEASSVVESIRQNNSENTITPSSIMSVTISDLRPDDSRRHNPYHTNKVSIDEREFVNNEYTDTVGKRYSVDRYMPSPYVLELQLDIWTINTTTKLQILEQILTIFNPSVQIQQNDNPIDWTSMFDVKLERVTWTNRNIQARSQNEKDIATLNFKLDIWINPPAKVERKTLIHQINSNIYEIATMPNKELLKYSLEPLKNCFETLEQIITTPGNHLVNFISDTQAQLLNSDNTPSSWTDLISLYGEYVENVTTIILKNSTNESDNDDAIYGTINISNDETIANINIDYDTIDPPPAFIINGIINPLQTYPANGITLTPGMTFIITEDIPISTGLNPWGQINAKKNDIIMFDGSWWTIVLDASLQTSENTTVKTINGTYYTLRNNSWEYTYRRKYYPGEWRLVMQKC